jgi:hypothetical protein
VLFLSVLLSHPLGHLLKTSLKLVSSQTVHLTFQLQLHIRALNPCPKPQLSPSPIVSSQFQLVLGLPPPNQVPNPPHSLFCPPSIPATCSSYLVHYHAFLPVSYAHFLLHPTYFIKNCQRNLYRNFLLKYDIRTENE